MKILTENKGQTLVLLMVYVVIALMVITAAIAISITNSQGTDKTYSGTKALNIAESGIENAIIRLIRDPDYSGEALTVNNGTATITVTGSSTIKTITSVGVLRNFSRTIQATVEATNSAFIVTGWEEI